MDRWATIRCAATPPVGPRRREPIGSPSGLCWVSGWRRLRRCCTRWTWRCCRNGWTFMGRARASLAAAEADVVAEISRREGDAAAEETLRRTQKRSRRGARKAVKVAAQLEWAPNVADKLAEGAITPEAAGLILDAEGPVDQRELLAAAETEPEDQFRTHPQGPHQRAHQRTGTRSIAANAQRRRRRATISEQGDGMFHPLRGTRSPHRQRGSATPLLMAKIRRSCSAQRTPRTGATVAAALRGRPRRPRSATAISCRCARRRWS